MYWSIYHSGQQLFHCPRLEYDYQRPNIHQQITLSNVKILKQNE